MNIEDFGLTREQVVEVSRAADHAAVKRAEELGLPEIAVAVGLDFAAKIAVKTYVLIAILGDEGSELLFNAITEKEEKEMHEEAERILGDEH